MIRLSEEQRAILSCYSGTKEEVIAELRKAIPFIDDVELRDLSAELLIQMVGITNDEYLEIMREEMLDTYDESREEVIE